MSGYWIDICDASLAKLGAGPIRTAESVRITKRLDRAGEVSFSMPAVDSRASLIVAKNIARVYTLRGGVVVNIGDMIIDKVQVSAAASDAPMLAVSGDDLLGELANRTVGALELSNGTGGPTTIANALSSIMALAPAGWTIDTATYTTSSSTVYLKFQNETVLAALSKLAQTLGEHFRRGTGREVVWLYTNQPSSSVRAVMSGDTAKLRANTYACVITSLQEVSDTHAAVTRVYARGGGNETAAVTLQAATDTPPAGYTRANDSLGYYLKHDSSDTANRIDSVQSFKDIAVLGSQAGAAASAANTLQQATYTYLRQHLPGTPVKSYRLAVAGLERAVEPGETIRAIYRKTVGSYVAVNIDATLVVLEPTIQLTSNGARTVGMTVAITDRWPTSDVEELSGALSTVDSMDRHLQKVPQATLADTATIAAGTSLTAGTIPFSGTAGVFAEDTTNLLWDDTTNTLTATNMAAEAWIAPTFSGTWANVGGGFNNAGYYKDPFGVVHLRGLVKSGTIPSTIFTLPVGYRPTAQYYLVVLSQGAIGRLDIATSGTVSATTGNNLSFSLDNIHFRTT
jgi:hypothetical protein